MTTQTGIPIIDCTTCGYQHPVTRTHCPACGLATLFGHQASRPQQTIVDALEATP